jgi:hypothetical protein
MLPIPANIVNQGLPPNLESPFSYNHEMLGEYLLKAKHMSTKNPERDQKFGRVQLSGT